MPEAKVKSLMVHEVDPRNAQGTVEVDIIDSVVASDQEKKCVTYCVSSVSCLYMFLFFTVFSPNAFVAITAGRVFNLVAESPAMMHKWISGQ